MLRIGIAFSLKPDAPEGPPDGPDDRFEEFDKPETVEAIASVIRREGHDVSLLGDGREFLSKMLAAPPDFVFNFAEGQGVRRDREARVPAVCEMLGVPYSGSDPLTLAVALDKDMARRIVKSAGGHAPNGTLLPARATTTRVAETIARLLGNERIRFPAILKPSFEGSSKGIRGDCVVEDAEQAVALHARLARDYGQPIVLEEFIEGDEVTVGVIDPGGRPEILGIMRVVPKAKTERFVYSLEVKRDWAARVDYETPARLTEATRALVEHEVLRAYEALGCRDIARIDLRLRGGGSPYFIEANPLPGLSPGTSDLVILAEGYGLSHEGLIRLILRAALERVGLAGPGSRPA